MVDKCDICGTKIETTFLGKIRGTIVSKKYVCYKCQGKYKNGLKKELRLE